MVESLIVLGLLPVILIMFFAVNYFGHAFTHKIKVHSAARYAAIKYARSESINFSQFVTKTGPVPFATVSGNSAPRAFGFSDGKTNYERAFLGLFFILGPLVNQYLEGEPNLNYWDIPHFLPAIFVSIWPGILPRTSVQAQASVSVRPTPGMRFVGSRSVSSHITWIDANSWRQSESGFFSWFWWWKKFYAMQFLFNRFDSFWVWEYSTLSHHPNLSNSFENLSFWTIPSFLFGIYLFLFI